MNDTKGQPPESDAEDDVAEGDLTAVQEKAIAALLSAVTVEAAAKKAGVSDRTLHRWLRDPPFRQAYLAARRVVMEQAVGRLQRASLGAVDALVRNLKCGQPATEVRAAQVILESGMKGVEMLEFEERLATIEQNLAQTGEPSGSGSKLSWNMENIEPATV